MQWLLRSEMTIFKEIEINSLNNPDSDSPEHLRGRI